MPVQPETRYAKSGDVHIAYQVVGEGELDLVWIPSLAHHVELSWEVPPVARTLDRLAELGRLILFDKRGTGMSDRVSSDTTLETRMDDIRAVMGVAGSQRAVVCALGEGGPHAMLFAATYPERTDGLVLINATPRFVRSAEFPWLFPRAEQEQRNEEMVAAYEEPSRQREMLSIGNPDMSEEERSAFARVFRLSVSPGAMRDYARMNLDVDVSGVLDSIRVPTLVLHRRELAVLGAGGRYLADHIPGARFVELPGRNMAPAVGDGQEQLFEELARFCSDIRSGTWASEEPDRTLATVLFTDIVGSTEKMSELGDRGWRELLNEHHAAVRRQLSRFRGVEMDTADGFFARFDGPARAIRCAQAVSEAVRELGIEVRAGLHTGECELVDGKVAGIAVSVGARIAAAAQAGEVLVSSTVKDLVAGSEISFQDRGSHQLKGVAGEWQLYAVES